METMRERRLNLRESTEVYEKESRFSVLQWTKVRLNKKADSSEEIV